MDLARYGTGFFSTKENYNAEVFTKAIADTGHTVEKQETSDSLHGFIQWSCCWVLRICLKEIKNRG